MPAFCRMRTGTLGYAIMVILLLGATWTPARAQTYPNRPVDFIVNWGAGGGGDQFARTIAPLVGKELGVPLPVSNVPGASGNTGLAKLNSLTADGYTVCLLTAVTFSTFVNGQSPFTVDDFDWLVRAQYTPSMLFVAKDSPFKTIDDLVAAAKANPGKITVGTDGFGTPGDLTLKALAKKGIVLKNIPFDDASERNLAPVAGHVDVLYEEPGDVKVFLGSGRIRPLVLFNDARLAEFPNVPTAREIKLVDIVVPNWRALVMRKGTPKEELVTLAAAFKKAMATPAWQNYCSQDAACDPEALALDELRAWVKKLAQDMKSVQ